MGGKRDEARHIRPRVPSRLPAARWSLRVLLVGVVVAGTLSATARPASAKPSHREIAAANRRSVASIDRILADPTARVGAGNRLYYVDPGPAGTAPIRAQSAASALAAPAPAAPFPYSQTFLLHSRPGSNRVIYLDFNGHNVSGTAWNNDPSLGTPSSFYAEPFSIDGSTAFTDAEQDIIQSVWQRMSEDFAVFDVDVTTADPGQAAIDRTSPSDLVFGTRAVITNTHTIYDSCGGCGGIGYNGAFAEPFYHAEFQPAFVFNLALGGNPKYLSEAASHEVGHNFDLAHDGGPSSPEYYGGHGAWAPIMGSAYSRPISQWSKGEYAGATNAEDDLAIIAANGAPLLPDDHGDVATSATGLTAGPAMSAAGVITTDADVDAFRFRADAGAATFSVAPAANGPNLDLRLELRTPAGAVVASSDPPSAAVTYDQASGLAASVSTTLPAAGDYLLFVSGGRHRRPHHRLQRLRQHRPLHPHRCGGAGTGHGAWCADDDLDPAR